MAVKGGSDRRELRPLDQEPGILGGHRGNYEALNIRNAQPDMHYRYESVNQSTIQRSLNQGYGFLKDDDPEEWGVDESEIPMRVQARLDTQRAYQDVVPMKTDLENYRRIQSDHDARSRAALDGAEAAYMTEGERNEAATGGRSGESPLHFMRRGHKTESILDKE